MNSYSYLKKTVIYSYNVDVIKTYSINYISIQLSLHLSEPHQWEIAKNHSLGFFFAKPVEKTHMKFNIHLTWPGPQAPCGFFLLIRSLLLASPMSLWLLIRMCSFSIYGSRGTKCGQAAGGHVASWTSAVCGFGGGVTFRDTRKPGHTHQHVQNSEWIYTEMGVLCVGCRFRKVIFESNSHLDFEICIQILVD